MSSADLESSTRLYATSMMQPMIIGDIVAVIVACIAYVLLPPSIDRFTIAFFILLGIMVAFMVGIMLRTRRFIVTPEGVAVSRLFGKKVELEWRHIRGIDIHPKTYQVHYVDAGSTLSFADPTELALPESFHIPKKMPRAKDLLARIQAGIDALPKDPLTPEQRKAVEQETTG